MTKIEKRTIFLSVLATVAGGLMLDYVRNRKLKNVNS